jgi:hypothetical protein
MPLDPSSPGLDSSEENVYNEFLEAMLDRAIAEMDAQSSAVYLQDTRVPPGGDSRLKVMWKHIGTSWQNFKQNRQMFYDLAVRWSGQSKRDEEELERKQHKYVGKARANLKGILGQLKSLAGDNPSESTQALLLTFDQIALWWSLIYAPSHRCDLLILEKNSETGATTVTEFEFETGKWDEEKVEMDSTLLESGTLPGFSSLSSFSAFCESSATESTFDMIVDLLRGQYS